MSFQGRSLDDLPLAAYRTGGDRDELDESPESEAEHPPMDARAAALSIVEPSVVAPAADRAKPEARRRTLPRPQLPRLRLPRPRLPSPRLPAVRFPSFRRPGASVVATASPLAAAPPAASAPVFPNASVSPGAPVSRKAPASPRAAVSPAASGFLSGPALPSAPERPNASLLPRAARLALRHPRMLAGAALVVPVVVLAVVLGAGGLTSGGAAAGPSSSPAPAAATPPPGFATMTLSGAVTGEYSLAGTTGFGRSSDGRLASTWADALGNVLTLTGQESSGTRPTGPDLALTWTMLVDGSPVTFASSAGECVVGMALERATVKGSVVCQKLRSDDGKTVVQLAGTYRT